MPTDPLSTTFAALADPTRRAILARLVSGETTVTELAEPFAMSLPAVTKHLKVLARAGLISRVKPRKGARACGAHQRWPRSAMATVPTGSGAAAGSFRLGGAVPTVLGRAPGSSGDVPARFTWPEIPGQAGKANE